MTNLSNLRIHLGQLESGKWLAATGASPYFCVEADTEEAVKKLAKEALAFYDRALDRRREQPVRANFTRTITAGELVAA